MEALEINNESKGKCCFCFKNSDFNFDGQKRINVIVHDIYNSCMKYINSDYLIQDEFVNWCQPNPLPFCKKCLGWSFKLNQMNQKLEQIQKQIEMLVNSFVTEFLKSRENPNTCSDDDSEKDPQSSNNLSEDLDDLIHQEFIHIKQEHNDPPDFFDENEGAEFSPFDAENQGSIDNMNLGSEETKPEVKYEKKYERRKNRKKSKTKMSFKKELNSEARVNLRRVKLDPDGNPISDDDLLPRRKAAVKAEKTFAAWNDDVDNLSDNDQNEGSESDGSISEDESNPSTEEAELKATKEFKKVRSRKALKKYDDKPFECVKCNKFYTTKSHLAEHILTHDKNNRFKCTICDDVSFAYARGLRQHMFKHKHNLLKKQTAQNDDLDHLKDTDQKEDNTLDTDRSVSENKSNDASADEAEIGAEVKKVQRKKTKTEPESNRERTDKPFECVKCNKFYTTKWHLADHMLTHNSSNRFKCEICEDVSFAYSRGLRQHMYKHKHNLLFQKEFKCLKCVSSFKTSKELIVHKREQHKHMSYECSLCGISYTYLKSLQQHSLDIHKLHLTYEGEQISVTSDKPEIDILSFCNICNKQYKNKETLKSHKRKVHGPREKLFCEQCNKEFKTSYGLKEHMEKHNRDPNDEEAAKRFTCKICEKVFASRGGYNVHILKHSNAKRFECTMNCGKCFPTKAQMLHHLLYHKGERAFLCEECGKSFFTKAKLKDHNRIHTGLLHFCEYCGKGFQTTTHLKQHHRSHIKKTIDNPVEIEPALPVPENVEFQHGIFKNFLQEGDVSSVN